jgi:hypothetical protein
MLVRGDASSDKAGFGLASPDLDGDGVADLMIGAPGATSNTGYVGVFLGGSYAGDVDMSDADVWFTGGATSDEFGFAVAVAGDVDADGNEDLLVGARYANFGGNVDCGVAYVFDGAPALSGGYTVINASARVYGVAAYDELGSVVAGAGDVNRDGAADVLVSAPQANSAAGDAGSAYLLYGTVVGAVVGSSDVSINGSLTGDNVADALAGVGDTDGDGYDDFMVGAIGIDTGATAAGAAFLFLGSGL